MRLPGGHGRRQQRDGARTLSLAANALLGCALLHMYLSSAGLPSTEGGVGGQAEALMTEMRAEIANISTALGSTLGSLEAQEQQRRSQQAAADAQLQAAQQQLAALRSESLVAQTSAETRLQEAAALRNETRALQQQLAALQSNQQPAVADKLWLVIGIPTVPRRNGTDYLTRCLSTLLEELPLDPTDPLYRRVRVIVMNNRPGEHPVWRSIADRVADPAAAASDVFARKAALYVDFRENPGTVPDPTPDAPDPDDSNNPSNRPGRQVRRQTADLISLLELAQPQAHYMVLMEDDFRVCPGMLRILAYAVRKLNTVPGYGRWLALRFSYGMNGVLLRTSDLPSFTAFLRKHLARLPPDLLWVEWFRGRRPELRQQTRGRLLAVYRHNLLDHIGEQSSFASRAARPAWPRCWHPMSAVWSLARTEQFNERLCKDADISPCPRGDGGETWTRYPVAWPEIREGEEQDHPPQPPPPPASEAAAPADSKGAAQQLPDASYESAQQQQQQQQVSASGEASKGQQLPTELLGTGKVQGGRLQLETQTAGKHGAS